MYLIYKIFIFNKVKKLSDVYASWYNYFVFYINLSDFCKCVHSMNMIIIHLIMTYFGNGIYAD